ncbi:hypothetical protein B0H17DRAFT_1140109 [Mycena rosella]|uniref:Uncharacterized protein n=1 Tax=Mycena rosella TaxID=1033263 RepID=A0AAD7D2N4_MYCRO|nr:hypothetical protein B0H17DRAFT_1140109 [Mycena rosella]
MVYGPVWTSSGIQFIDIKYTWDPATNGDTMGPFQTKHRYLILYYGRNLIAEVQFFFCAEFDGIPEALALCSYNTVWSAGYEQAKSLLLVVAMILHEVGLESLNYFLVEKLGLDVICLAGYKEEDNVQEADDLEEGLDILE